MTELTIDQALQKAIEAHKAGQVQEADRLYTAILKAQPKHPDANHNMGVLAVGFGKVQEALPFFKTALEANPATVQFWLSYIDALITLEKLHEAQSVLNQAKSKGAKGDGFNKLEQRLQDAEQEPLESNQIASEPQPKQPNILDSLKLDQAISLAKKKAKNGLQEEARRIYQDILTKFPKNKRASDGIKVLAGRSNSKEPKIQEPSQGQLQQLINLCARGTFKQALEQVNTLVKQFPKSANLFNIQGVIHKGLRQLDLSVLAYQKALTIEPNYAEAFFNLGISLQEQGKLEKAIDSFKRALAIQPNNAEACNNMGVTLQANGKLEEAIDAYKNALTIKANYSDAYYNMGNALKKQGKFEEAIEAYKKVFAVKPDSAEAYNNMGNILKTQGRLDEAFEAYKKAISIKPNYIEAYRNKGVILQEQHKLEEAIGAFTKVINIKPNFSEAYSDVGNVLKKQGKLDDAIASYKKAVSIKPDNAQTYNNMGATLQEQGQLEDAIQAYKKALSIKHDYAQAHRHLSTVSKYKPNDPQISKLIKLMKRRDLKDVDLCHFHYTFAKMNEDLGQLGIAYESYTAGGILRQKLLAYNLQRDQLLFAKIKQTAQSLKNFMTSVTSKTQAHIPIFILGMPRSGTTLVEQIISCHSKVNGAGELPFISRFGDPIATGLEAITTTSLSKFRQTYLEELAKVSGNCKYVTDKMPHNFLYLGLIFTAFPDAKIIHVKRNPAATCWSNFKHYFPVNGLGYSYDLNDTVRYFEMYKDLMDLWDTLYGENIYHLDYDRLTVEQESETKKLIKYLELQWEETCMSPEKNKRSVRTASQQQVKNKVYEGSSLSWQKFKPYLHGVLDHFSTTTEHPPR